MAIPLKLLSRYVIIVEIYLHNFFLIDKIKYTYINAYNKSS